MFSSARRTQYSGALARGNRVTVTGAARRHPDPSSGASRRSHLREGRASFRNAGAVPPQARHFQALLHSTPDSPMGTRAQFRPQLRPRFHGKHCSRSGPSLSVRIRPRQHSKSGAYAPRRSAAASWSTNQTASRDPSEMTAAGRRGAPDSGRSTAPSKSAFFAPATRNKFKAEAANAGGVNVTLSQTGGAPWAATANSRPSFSASDPGNSDAVCPSPPIPSTHKSIPWDAT